MSECVGGWVGDWESQVGEWVGGRVSDCVGGWVIGRVKWVSGWEDE